MATKQLLPNQCMPLHFIYGPSDCCLCGARLEVEQLKRELAAAKRDLAVKVLAAIPEVGVTWDDDQYENWISAPLYRDIVITAIKSAFTTEGVILEGRGDDET